MPQSGPSVRPQPRRRAYDGARPAGPPASRAALRRDQGGAARALWPITCYAR